MLRFTPSHVRLALLSALVLSSLATLAHAQSPTIKSMASQMPSGVNSVVVLNVAKIRESQIAQSEGWCTTPEGRIASGFHSLPIDANIILLAAPMDYETFHPRFVTSLMSFDQAPSLVQVREITGGRIDEILKTQTIETPSDHYVTRLNDNLVAAFRPAMRPEFAKWLSDLKNDESSRMKDYLEEGLNYAEELGTELIIAFNLKHVVSRTRVYEDAKTSDVLQEHVIEPKAFSAAVASLRGITLGATVRDKVFASVKFDFDEDISIVSPVAETLVSDILDRTGISLPEFEEWKPIVKANQIVIRGDLSVSSFRRLVSVLGAPDANVATPRTSNPDMSGGDLRIVATKEYFDAVNSYLADVTPKLDRTDSYTKNAKWLRKFAEKIEGLRQLDVDSNVLDYGDYVAQSLRNAQLVLIDIREDSGNRARTLLDSGRRGYHRGGRYGYGYRGGNGARERSNSRAKFKSDAVKSVTDIFSQVTARQNELRRELDRDLRTTILDYQLVLPPSNRCLVAMARF